MDAVRSSSASLCPGCGKAIDPLRAGHVAIIDGGFRYFCGPECKVAFLEGSSRRGASEALTAEPAGVVRSGLREKGESEPEGEGERESESEPVETPSFPSSPGRGEESPETLRSIAKGEDLAEAAPADGETEDEEERAVAAAPPSSAEDERAPAAAVSSRGAAVESGRWAAHVAVGAPIVGIALGVLAFVVSLAGESGGWLRLPFALTAAAVLVGVVLLRPRAPGDPAAWLIIGPVALAACGAVFSAAVRDPRADAHAAYVGLAAAAALLVDRLIIRARRDLVDARARIHASLDGRVRVVRGDSTSEQPAAQVRPGEQVVVEVGEMVGVDGIVTAGEGEVAPWLDSPVVRGLREGDAVVAGASVVSGRLRITATFAGAERAWVKLHHANAQRVDVASPLVVVARQTVERGAPIAALLVGGATYANNGGWPEVVIAASAGAYAVAGLAAVAAAGLAHGRGHLAAQRRCIGYKDGHAFGVAAAGLAHGRGHLAAQRRGIVYKDADAFDAAARADVAVVCSRGTILLGEPEIVAIEAVASRGAEIAISQKPEDTARVLSLAAGAELASIDALGAAILRASRARGVAPENVRSALAHAGLGVTALVASGDKVIVGSRAFLLQEKVSVAIADARVTELEAQGRSVLLVALGDRLVGLLALQDGLRPGARAAVQRMHDARIEPVLLSGEARDTCETIARALDIEHVRPEILPGDRGAEVRALADGGRIVAAVGHPSSDDGALGAADVSVAMTAAGAAPGEWAVALASDDVRDAALALTVPRACRDRARTAALVAAGTQALALLGIAFGVAPPAVAPIAAAVAAAAALAIVRDPTVLTSGSGRT